MLLMQVQAGNLQRENQGDPSSEGESNSTGVGQERRIKTASGLRE